MQSRRQSIIEICTSTFTGMLGSWIIIMIVSHNIPDLTQAATVNVVLCTIWSLVRGYMVRRHFNRRMHREPG